MTTDPKIVPGPEVDFAQVNLNPDLLPSAVASGSSVIAPKGVGGLELVSDEAVTQFAAKLAGMFALRPLYGLCFMYLFEPKYHNLPGSPTEIKFVPIATMKLADFLEATKRITGEQKDVFGLVKDPSNLETEITLSNSMFIEMDSLKSLEPKLFNQHPVGPYFPALKYPPRVRTLIAGTTHYLLGQNRNFDEKFTSAFESSKADDLQISTRDIFDYARSLGLQNVGFYLNLLGDKK